MSILDILRPVPHMREIEDEEEIRKQYRHWRFRIFYGMYIGYIFYYFSRKSLTFAVPAIMAQTGFSQSQMGLLASLLSLMYGLSKFMSGIIADRSNPRYFMSIGLIMTGLSALFFGFSSSLILFAIFSIVNGFFQGWGWPPCARQLTHWYSQKERGTWWGIWNTSHSIGISGIAMLGAVLASNYGWRTSMCIPGILCIFAGFFIMNRLRDTPQSLGLPPIEKFKNDYPATVIAEEKELSAKEVLFRYVLNNNYIWMLGAAYFFVYVVRQGITDWGVLYLTQGKHYSSLFASSCIVSFEVGGFCGSLASGWISDYFFKGKRGPVNTLFSLGVIFPLIGLLLFSDSTPFLDSLLFFTIGVMIYGPQMVIGMHAAEIAHKKAAGTATGFIGWFAYLGGAVAGYPLSLLSQTFGWGIFVIALLICSIIALLLLVPLWSIRVHPKHAQESI